MPSGTEAKRAGLLLPNPPLLELDRLIQFLLLSDGVQGVEHKYRRFR